MKAIYCFLFLLLCSCGQQPASERTAAAKETTAKPINDSRLVRGNGTKVLKNLSFVDVVAGEVRKDLTVVVKDDRIWWVGPANEVEVSQGSEVLSLEGKFLMPGLIDSHFHLDKLFGLPHIYLKNGITSVRDPGAWIEAYDEEIERGESLPRLFLTGPHFDTSPPAHPHDAVIVRDEEEARRYVNKFADQGSTAIKVYYRLPLGTIKAVCEEAHKRGLMVTSTNARFLQVEKELGTIEEGKIADLIVLDHNPLEDIGHVNGISGLMLNGHWVSLEE